MEARSLEYVHKVGDAIVKLLNECTPEHQPSADTAKVASLFMTAIQNLEAIELQKINGLPQNRGRK